MRMLVLAIALCACAQGNQARTEPTTPLPTPGGGDQTKGQPGTWTLLSDSSAPSARANHTAVWTGADMLVYGGTDATQSLLGDGGDFQAARQYWLTAPLSGVLDARKGHTAVATTSGMVVWGGQIRNYVTNELEPTATGGIYDAGGGWTETAPDGAPEPRYGHSAISTGDAMIVFGGTSASQGHLGDGATFWPARNTWEALPQAGAPTARFGHSAVWTGTKMLIWGGASAASLENTGAVYDPAAKAWTAMSTKGAPTARKQHAAVWIGDAATGKMVVFGGRTDAGMVDVGGVYDPATDQWSPMSTAAAPSPRTDHTAVATSATMIVFGGNGPGGVLADGGIYYPGGDKWVAIPAQTRDEQGLHNRTPRANHTAVWTGQQMILFGGVTTDGSYVKKATAFTPP
jgi:hypothetical protein